MGDLREDTIKLLKDAGAIMDKDVIYESEFAEDVESEIDEELGGLDSEDLTGYSKEISKEEEEEYIEKGEEILRGVVKKSDDSVGGNDLKEDVTEDEDLKDTGGSSEVGEESENKEEDVEVKKGDDEYVVKEKDVLYDSTGNPVEFQVDGEIYTEYINLEDILIPPRSRRVQEKGTEDLEKLILQWGLIDPLHVIPFKGKYLLVHGFRRYRALKNLGYSEALCLVDTTRPKATVRFLEVIHNNTERYNFFEVMDFGEFIERKQKTFQNRTIENIIGMEPGDYLKAKYIRQFDQFGIIGDILTGKKTIKSGFKKLERELEKLEKEQQELALENFDDQGLPESYLDVIEDEAEVQSTDDRHPLPKHISDRVKARDGYTCQSCGLGYHQPELISVFEVHHIVPVFQEGRDEDSNLILTCSNCHKVIHAYSDGKFSPPEGRVKYYKNMILLGNIIKRGLPEGISAYNFYMENCEQPWVR